MESKKLGVLGGALYTLSAILGFVYIGIIINSGLSNGNKLFVILLGCWQQICIIVFELIIAFSMFNDKSEKGLLIGLIGLLILSIINALQIIPTQLTTMPLIAIMELITTIVPKVLLIIFYFKSKDSTGTILYYLPALIYFVANLFPLVASIINYLGAIMTFSTILSIVGHFITTFALLVLGAFIKEN